MSPEDRTPISDRTFDREAVEQSVGLQALIQCDLAEADLSRFDLSGWSFERCNMRKMDFSGAKLERTRWRSCRATFANLTGCDLTEATIAACDFNNAIFKCANAER